ncbi:MAG: hypothetical protein HRT83_02125 [Hyphomicrobiaceae bacterium]|nr:hypothetical protein [Hyphomicrobiaceae bacterium]
MYGFFISFPIVVTAFLLPTKAATDSEICVKCNQPGATYLCQLIGTPKYAFFMRNRNLTKLACMRQIAKAYMHRNCKVNKKKASICDGKLILVDLKQFESTTMEKILKPLHYYNDTLTGASAGSQMPKPQKDEPKTILELAKRTARGSREWFNMISQKTNETAVNLGKFLTTNVVKTWKCLSSLFSNCKNID